MISKSVHTQLLAVGARKGLRGFVWMLKIIVPVSLATTLLDARRLIRLIGIVGAIAAALWSGSLQAEQAELPFRPGEKLTFELKWTLVPAGQATLEVKPIEQVDGKDAYHFRLTARSNRIVDAFYKVRDRIDGYTDMDITRSVFYAKRQREGKTKKNVVVRFDWGSQTAEYTEFIKRSKKGPVALLPGAFDPLSIFYYTRKQSFEVGKELQRPVTDGKKCVLGKAKILRREKITVPAGEFETFLIVPDLKHVGGVFKKSKNAKIELWVSADERRLPIKLKSEVIVGSFTGELITYEP